MYLEATEFHELLSYLESVIYFSRALQGSLQQVCELGGGGGGGLKEKEKRVRWANWGRGMGGVCPPENFDFHSSQIPQKKN